MVSTLATIAAITERKRQTVLNVSLGTSIRNDSISFNEDDVQNRPSYNFDDCSLRLAEVVVRVGRQVVAATLSEKPTSPYTIEQCLEVPELCKSTENIPIGFDGGNPHTPISGALSRPPSMKLSLHGSPTQETPIGSRRV